MGITSLIKKLTRIGTLHMSTQKKQYSLDLQKMEGFFSESIASTENFHGSDVVLVIGNTGAGKSTTINYLIGREMKREKIFGKIVVVPKIEDSSIAGIGHTSESHTLHPTVYKSADGKITYIDCPGFMDNRGYEERAWISIATEMTVKKSKIIKAVLVVIDYNSINTDKGAGFKSVMDTLGKLLKEPEKVSNSLLFCFTKAPPLDTGEEDENGNVIYRQITVEEIHQNIKNLYDTQSNKVAADSKLIRTECESLPKNDPNLIKLHEDIDALNDKLKILKIIVDNKDKIAIVNPTDKGNSRKELTQKIKKSIDVPYEHFNFNRYDQGRIKFDKFVGEIARDALNLIKEYQELSDGISKSKRKISKIDYQIANLEMEVENLKIHKTFTEKKIQQEHEKLNSVRHSMDQNKNLFKMIYEIFTTVSSDGYFLTDNFLKQVKEFLLASYPSTVFEVNFFASKNYRPTSQNQVAKSSTTGNFTNSSSNNISYTPKFM